MADRPIPPGAALSQLPDIQLSKGPDGRQEVAPSALLNLIAKVNEIVSKLKGLVSLGDGSDGSWTGNVDGQHITWTFTIANTEALIPHLLKRTPKGYWVTRSTVAARLYDSNPGGWSPVALYLKCDVPATVSILVF